MNNDDAFCVIMIRVCVYFRRWWWCFFTDLRRVRLFLLDLRRRDLRPPENVAVLPPLTTKKKDAILSMSSCVISLPSLITIALGVLPWLLDTVSPYDLNVTLMNGP